MNIEYVAKHVDLNDSIRQFTEEKLGKVIKFLQDPVEIRVTLEQEKHRQIADLHISHRLGVLQAKEETQNLLDAINMAVEKVEKQARRSRKKYKDKRRRADRVTQDGLRWPVTIFQSDSLGEGRSPQIIESTHIEIVPMTVEEAAEELAESSDQFVVFRNAGSNQVSVLYKRKDSHYGLITPEP